MNVQTYVLRRKFGMFVVLSFFFESLLKHNVGYTTPARRGKQDLDFGALSPQ